MHKALQTTEEKQKHSMNSSHNRQQTDKMDLLGWIKLSMLAVGTEHKGHGVALTVDFLSSVVNCQGMAIIMIPGSLKHLYIMQRRKAEGVQC